MINLDPVLSMLAIVGGLLAIAVLAMGFVVARRARHSGQSDVARHEREEQFTALIRGVTDYAIYMIDLDGRVAGWNPGAERNKGYTAEEIIGQPFARFYTDEDRAAGLPQRALQTAAEKGKY